MCGWSRSVSRGSTHAALLHTTIAHTPRFPPFFLLPCFSVLTAQVFPWSSPFPPTVSLLSPQHRGFHNSGGRWWRCAEPDTTQFRRAGLVLPLLSLTLNLLFNSSLPNTSDSQPSGWRRTCRRPRSPPSAFSGVSFIYHFLCHPPDFVFLTCLTFFPPRLSLHLFLTSSLMFPHSQQLPLCHNGAKFNTSLDGAQGAHCPSVFLFVFFFSIYEAFRSPSDHLSAHRYVCSQGKPASQMSPRSTQEHDLAEG